MSVIDNLTKWQNYFHYLLLAGGVFFIHFLTDIWGIEMMAVNGGNGDWIVLFLFYALGLFVIDTLIHLMFSVLPKPLKWED